MKRATQHAVHSWVRILRSASEGQDLIEYALVAALIALIAGSLMPGVADQFNTVMSKVHSVVVSAGNESSGNT